MRTPAVLCLILVLLGLLLPAAPAAAAADPVPPAGAWLTSASVPGFRFKVRLAGSAMGKKEAACIAETLCVSGALAGRSEVFLRVVGPKPNGRLWPTLVKFSTSQVEVWVEQTGSGVVRYYELGASGQGSSLPGVVDRSGFSPSGASDIAEAVPEETLEITTEPVQAISPRLLRDIRPGSGSSSPRDFHRVGGLVYFLATTSDSTPAEVWRTDGTSAGTFRVSPAGRMFTSIWKTGGSLAWFVGPPDDEIPLGSREIWRSDGTEAGTFRVATLAGLPDPEAAGLVAPWYLYVPELDRLFFACSETSVDNLELWASDGTAAGTFRVSDLNPAGSSYPGRMVALNGRLFFVALGSGGETDREVWTSDGTTAGTGRLTELDGVEALAVAGGRLLFFSRTEEGTLKLWRSDGTVVGTAFVADLPGSRIGTTQVAADRLYFTLTTPGGPFPWADRLWVTDPSGDKAYYGRQLTAQGGRLSRDFTGGYGPEEFSLKHAQPGRYRVEAQYYGDRRQRLTGPTTLQVKFYTGFGRKGQQERSITLRLAERSETVFVGEFEVAH